MTETLTPAATTSVGLTRGQLVEDLRALGVASGKTLLVHASLRRIGWVDGGAPTVVAALRDALGEDGTLVAGAGTPENSMTSRAFRAETDGFTKAEKYEFRKQMPAFDRNSTPTSVGAVAEAVRTTSGAVRSAHPQTSFSAVGRQARSLMAGHQLHCHLGEESPLGKLYKQDASILLLGVGYEVCTAFHLAEYRYTREAPMRNYYCVVMGRNGRRWRRYRDVVLDDSEFEVIGKSLDNEKQVPSRTVGGADSRLISLRDAVDFATDWMRDQRLNPAPMRGPDLSNVGWARIE
jgi:aminoglycoside 3-N-acetyltransferase